MVGHPLQRGVGIDEIGRSHRTPRANVSLPPAKSRELAASFGEHFGRGIDSDDFGIWKRVGKDAGQVPGSATEAVDRRIFGLGDATDEIEAGPEADVGIAKVSLRLPGGHRGQKKSYTATCEARMGKTKRGSLACDRAAPFRIDLRRQSCASCDKGGS